MFELVAYIRKDIAPLVDKEYIYHAYYNNFECAFSDIFDEDSTLRGDLRISGIEVDFEHPINMYAKHVRYDGYFDDFYIEYKDNLSIHIGGLNVQDEKYK